MTLCNIPNTAELFRTFDECENEIELQTVDGQKYSWREQREVLESFVGNVAAPIARLEVRCVNRKDTNRILAYCMECTRRLGKTA